MQPKIKVGLLVGVISLVLNICVAGAAGICGPAVSLAAGAIAGFLAVRQEKPLTKGDGAKAGAISGVIAGALVLIGQMIGTVGVLAVAQFMNIEMPLGQVPSTSADASMQIIYYASGLGTGICFGLVGLFLAALTGAGTGYLGTQETQNANVAG